MSNNLFIEYLDYFWIEIKGRENKKQLIKNKLIN
jgi:hypothetical protein